MKSESFRIEVCPGFMPEDKDMKPGILYYSPTYKTSSHLCACGCGRKVVCPIDKPHGWNMTEVEGLPTLSPSIGNFQFPCKSHYFIRDGNVVWC